MANEPGLMISAGRGQLDQSRDADLKEGAYGRPQIISDKFPTAIPLWSNQRDRGQDARYSIRQVTAPPSSMLEWLQLTCVPLLGAAIKYILWACWGAIGWYTLIPGVFLIGSLVGVLMGGISFKDTRYSAIFKFVLVCAGAVL